MAISEKSRIGFMHPGEYLNEASCVSGIDGVELAMNLHVPIDALEQIIEGECDVLPEFALRLGRYFGSGARMWLDLQNAYSLELTERKIGSHIQDQVVPLEHEVDVELETDELEEIGSRSIFECTALPIGIDGGPPAGLFSGLPPVHPGEILNEDLEFMGLTPETFADKLAISVDQMNAILTGERDVDAEFALRLERYFGSGARMWMNLQTTYSLKVAERDLGNTIVDEVAPRVDEDARADVVEAA